MIRKIGASMALLFLVGELERVSGGGEDTAIALPDISAALQDGDWVGISSRAPAASTASSAALRSRPAAPGVS